MQRRPRPGSLTDGQRPLRSNHTYYVYGLGLIGEETNGAYAAYHFDSRGSTVALTDGSGNVTDSFSYGPYGELNNHTGSSTTPFQFNGQFGVQTIQTAFFTCERGITSQQ